VGEEMSRILQWFKSLIGMKEEEVSLNKYLIGDHIFQTTNKRSR